MSPVLECIVAIFVIVLIVVAVVITIFLVKLIQELTLTVTSLKTLTDLVNSELKPALKSLNNILSHVNNVSVVTNNQLELLKKILTTILGASCVAFSGMKNKGGFIGGLISGFNLFRKKGDKKCL
jgi:predicted PurR-regulated permease PerM